jgi:recombinational DNA repair ATPase RecF
MLGMRLVSARIRMFRNIVDSGVIHFAPDVSCVVGKDESGKTALLQALHRQNPAPGTERIRRVRRLFAVELRG